MLVMKSRKLKISEGSCGMNYVFVHLKVQRSNNKPHSITHSCKIGDMSRFKVLRVLFCEVAMKDKLGMRD